MPTIEGNYQKRIGLPGYSSHSFSLSVRIDLDDVNNVDREGAKLFAMLQQSVDREIQEEGYLPEPDANGSATEPQRGNGNGSGNHRPNGRTSSPGGDYWKCSDRQRDLIEKIIDEHRLHSREVEQLSDELHRKPLKSLNKLEMSAVIQELIEKYGPAKTNGGNGGGGQYQRGGSRR